MEKNAFYKMFNSYYLFASRSHWWFLKMMLETNPYLPRGTIVDLETDGLDGKINHMLTLGMYRGDRIIVFQLLKPRYEKFKNLCRKTVQGSPQPYYAYAAQFEQEFLEIPEGWRDLTHYESVGGEWQYWRRRLTDVTRNPCESLEDWDIDARDVPEAWDQWLQTQNLKNLAEIPYHCMVDLLRERQLIK